MVVICGILLGVALVLGVLGFDDLRARKTRTAPLPTGDSTQGGRPDGPHPGGGLDQRLPWRPRGARKAGEPSHC